MGTVVQLKNQINNSYLELKNSVEDKLVLVDEKIKSKLLSKVNLVDEMTKYHLRTGGKRLRALLTLGSSKLCGYSKGSRDVNLAACVELIHAATLMHDDVIDNGEVRRGKKTLNNIWGNKSAILVGDYLLSRCFEMMVEDGSLEILKLQGFHLRPSFQNIYLANNLQLKLKIYFPKYYLKFSYLF